MKLQIFARWQAAPPRWRANNVIVIVLCPTSTTFESGVLHFQHCSQNYKYVLVLNFVLKNDVEQFKLIISKDKEGFFTKNKLLKNMTWPQNKMEITLAKRTVEAKQPIALPSSMIAKEKVKNIRF